MVSQDVLHRHHVEESRSPRSGVITLPPDSGTDPAADRIIVVQRVGWWRPQACGFAPSGAATHLARALASGGAPVHVSSSSLPNDIATRAWRDFGSDGSSSSRCCGPRVYVSLWDLRLPPWVRLRRSSACWA